MDLTAPVKVTTGASLDKRPANTEAVIEAPSGSTISERTVEQSTLLSTPQPTQTPSVLSVSQSLHSSKTTTVNKSANTERIEGKKSKRGMTYLPSYTSKVHINVAAELPYTNDHL